MAMIKMHDQAFTIENCLPKEMLDCLFNYAKSTEDFKKAQEASISGEVFYKFLSLSLRSKPYESNENLVRAINECHRVLFEILKSKTSFPVLEEEYSGISLCSNYSMSYHADAERPYCQKDRNLGVPNSSDNDGFIIPNKNEWQPNHTSSRIYTSLVYLNDDFEGGETTMPTRNLHVKPKFGKMFAFPCSRDYIHGIRKNTGGVRVAFTAWYTLASKESDDKYGYKMPTCLENQVSD